MENFRHYIRLAVRVNTMAFSVKNNLRLALLRYGVCKLMEAVQGAPVQKFNRDNLAVIAVDEPRKFGLTKADTFNCDPLKISSNMLQYYLPMQSN